MATLDMKELRERWMRFYMNIIILCSDDPKAKTLLDVIKQQSAEYNEKIMEFFDKMGVEA